MDSVVKLSNEGFAEEQVTELNMAATAPAGRMDPGGLVCSTTEKFAAKSTCLEIFCQGEDSMSELIGVSPAAVTIFRVRE